MASAGELAGESVIGVAVGAALALAAGRLLDRLPDWALAERYEGLYVSRPEKLFIAWFGPKGIASMLFALFVLNSSAPDRTLVFEVAAFTILASIVAHGLTDTVAGGWIERRVARSAG